MGDLIDNMRKTGQTHDGSYKRKALCWGIDPDLDTIGCAQLLVEWTEPIVRAPIISKVRMGTLHVKVRKGLKGLDQSNFIVSQCPEILGSITNELWLNTVAWRSVVEAQRVYPPPDDQPMSKTIAQANDLLRLAQVAGAFAGALSATLLGRESMLVQPTDWKGQGLKSHTALKAAKELADKHCMEVRLFDVRMVDYGWAIEEGNHVATGLLPSLPAKAGHAMDALGMALYCASQLTSGIWKHE